MRWTWWHFWLLFAIGAGISVIFALVLWPSYGWLMLLVPLIFPPILFRGRKRVPPSEGFRACPTCGFETEDARSSYCPRDGTRLGP